MQALSFRSSSTPTRWLVLAGLFVCGCEASKTTPGTTPTTSAGKTSTIPASTDGEAKASTESHPPAEPKPLLDGWEVPAAALLLTGEQHGYFEPCGCTLGQSGGMTRRASLVRQLEDRGWKVAGLDVGGTLRRARQQDQIKFDTILTALNDLHYEGLAVGVEELRLGADFLASKPQNSLALLSANVVLFDLPDLGTPRAFKTFTVGNLKVGVTAVLGDSLKAEVAPAGVNTNITIKAPSEVLPGVIQQLQAEKPQLMVLLSHGSLAEAEALAKAYPEFQVVLAAGGPGDPAGRPTKVGETWVIQAGHKGRYVGVLGIYPDATPQLKFELVSLDAKRFPDDAKMHERMREYQQRLKDEEIWKKDELLIRHPEGLKFVGADRCGECHTKAFAVWKETKHAHAWDSLIKGHARPEDKDYISRIYDPECLSCHVVGWEPQEMLRYESGFFDEATTPHLKGQQCEHCHGAGSAHVALETQFQEDAAAVDGEKLKTLRASMRQTLEQAKKSTGCYYCHDTDNSPNFKFEEYWDQIKHEGKD
ncbi:multiheme c-type cytochrome [Planctellipticum variicoloris]|uniref:multiheme c-type cytochrome n=1 Tax=Planctellipticum variicoloris TaxID=3064265 RepID=UPI003013E93E|nr:hypothetical protein SH412_003318 [Planctomycetaceae bacterium SH412]